MRIGIKKNRGVEHADLVVDALGDGIAEKTAHRHDGAVLQHLFPLRIIAVKKEPVQNETQKLHDDCAHKQHRTGLEHTRIQLNEAGFEDVARDDYIDAQVGQALFAVFVDDVLLFEQRADQHHRKKLELQAPQL